MSKVYKKIQVIFLGILLPLLATDGVLVCKMDNFSKIVTFSTLLEFQSSTSSFNPDESTYRGNAVEFTFSSIDKLERNAFISFGSQSIIKISLNAKGIRTIDDGAFCNLLCLHYLELRQNNISTLTTDVFKDLDNLRMLDLSENALQHISQNGMIFHKLYKLRILNLSKNNIVRLNTFDFFNLTSLQVLNLGFNKISVIPQDLFKYLFSLEELYLNSNNLMDIEPEKWKNLIHLKELNLAGNFLKKFDPSYNFSFVSLKNLNISKNSLNYLNVFEIRKSLPNLKIIDISANDWYCNDLQTIRHYLTDSKITVLGEVNCSISKGYRRPMKIELHYSTSSSTSGTTSRTTENNDSSYHLKDVFVQNDEKLFTTKSILKNIQKLQTLLEFLCVIIVIFVLVNITIRMGLCHNLYNRLVNRLHTEDGSDRERLILRP